MQELTFNVRPLAEVLAEGLSGRGSLVDQAYTLLRKQIVNLSLPPELALVEQEVASALEISKTPVREAIIRLSREGLVEVIPKSGSYVTAIGLDRYFEACFVRTQLEVACVRRLATRGIGLADQVTLKALLTEQMNALEQGDDKRFFELDETLHRRFFDLAGLSGVWEIMHGVKAEIDRVRHLKRLFGIRQGRSVLQEHAAIVDAIVDRDPDAAERCLLENIGDAEGEMSSMSENPQLLRTIEDLNELVALDKRTRGNKTAARM